MAIRYSCRYWYYRYKFFKEGYGYGYTYIIGIGTGIDIVIENSYGSRHRSKYRCVCKDLGAGVAHTGICVACPLLLPRYVVSFGLLCIFRK